VIGIVMDHLQFRALMARFDRREAKLDIR
jgi:hypothetical protein